MTRILPFEREARPAYSTSFLITILLFLLRKTGPVRIPMSEFKKQWRKESFRWNYLSDGSIEVFVAPPTAAEGRKE